LAGAAPPDLPDGLVHRGGTDTFTEETLPAALLEEHSLAPGRWGLLRVLGGGVWFVDLVDGAETFVSTGETRAILPEAPHRLRLEGPVTCRIEFFRLPNGD
jgi:hemoglobin